MLIQPHTRNGIEKLADKLARASGASAGLFVEVVAASPRLMTLRAVGKTDRLNRLVASEAWTDAATELVALEAPNWSIQRLCLDDGEWLCTLTRFPDVPDWLDDSAEGRHPVMALAVLGALLDIRTRTPTRPAAAALQPAGPTADCTDYR